MAKEIFEVKFKDKEKVEFILETRNMNIKEVLEAICEYKNIVTECKKMINLDDVRIIEHIESVKERKESQRRVNENVSKLFKMATTGKGD